MIRFIDVTSTALTFLLLISNFILMLGMWYTKLKSPENVQNERITKLEVRINNLYTEIEKKDARVKLLEEGNVVIQRSLLALMSHAINGDDTDKLKTAKDDLEKYLTSMRR